MDHDFVALNDAGRPFEEAPVEVAYHHVLGPHAVDHVDRITAALHDEPVRVRRIAKAHVPHGTPNARGQSRKAENVAAGQRAFAHRAKMNGLASTGKWDAGLEKQAA